MTNQVALFIVVLIGAGALADMVWNDGAGLMFLAVKFLELVEWVAFWR